jgi:hypothetical protein
MVDSRVVPKVVKSVVKKALLTDGLWAEMKAELG